MKSIAVVEDNESNRVLLAALLDREFIVAQYEDGPSALAGMRARPPDLVLMDISLPSMDGPEVLRELRREESLSSVPVIALTAHAMRNDRERFLAMGFDSYVSKPIVDETVLLSAIRALLKRPPLRKLSPRARSRIRAKFVAGLPDRLQRMHEVSERIEAGAPSALSEARVLGHQFAGTGSSFGYPETSRVGRELAQAVDGDVPSRLQALVDEVQRVLDAADMPAPSD
ncbi:MAG: response regulator [Myxococcota bacterium]